MAQEPHTPRDRNPFESVAVFAGLALFAVIMFRVVLAFDVVHFTTDDNIGVLAYAKRLFPRAFYSAWLDNVLVGVPQVAGINWRNILLWLLPLEFFVNWIHAINLLFASWFLYLFLRLKGLGWCAGLMGALTAFWLGSNFTLSYAGHLGKFSCLFFAAGSLWAIAHAAQRRSLWWSVLAGCAVGAMFLAQQDVALFIGIFLGAYAVRAVGVREGWRVKPLLQRLVPMGLAAVALGMVLVVRVYAVNVEGVASVSDEDPKQRWEFCTQWSWPPEECIDFIAPGFMGWRSGEAEGPYWGRMGRSPGWEATGQGFQNFKLENHYLGAIPVGLALWALFVAWRDRKQAGAGELLFWGIVTLLALGLAFGKHFILYRLFFMLPGMSSIRNPNKFLHIFQIALGILAAYGLHDLVRGERAGRAPLARRMAIGLGAFALLMAALAAIWSGSFSTIAARLATAGWGEAGEAIVRTRIHALWHGAVLTGAMGGLFWLLFRSKHRANELLAQRLPIALLLVVALDALLLGRMYVHPMHKDFLRETELVTLLKERLRNERLALYSQGGFYNQWLTYLFPYHNIPTLNVTQLPRMPEDYQALLAVAHSDPFRLWELTACRYLMGPSQAWGQIQQDERYRDSCELAFAFNPAVQHGAVLAVPGTQERPGEHCVILYNRALPRFAPLSNWEVVPDDQVLKRLFAPDYAVGDPVLLPPGEEEGLPPPVEEAGRAQVRVESYMPGLVRLQVSCEQPVLLRCAERYGPDWKAYVDGRPERVRRCDYLMQAVAVPAGLHQVRLEYAPSRTAYWVQLAGVALFFGAIVAVLLEGRRTAEQPGGDTAS